MTPTSKWRRFDRALAIAAAVTSVAAFVVGGLAFQKVAELASDANTAAKASCERTVQFGPPLADAYAKYRILTPRQIVAYRETIPKECPK